MNDYFNNFGMMIPKDIERHQDGTPCTAIWPNEKDAFIEFLEKDKISVEEFNSYSGKEKEVLKESFRQSVSKQVQPAWKTRKEMPVIPKTELKDGGYYIGKTYQRGMPIGLWDAGKGHFICIKPPEFGQFSLYEMNHIEDDDGFVCFEPVEKIEL